MQCELDNMSRKHFEHLQSLSKEHHAHLNQFKQNMTKPLCSCKCNTKHKATGTGTMTTTTTTTPQSQSFQSTLNALTRGIEKYLATVTQANGTQYTTKDIVCDKHKHRNESTTSVSVHKDAEFVRQLLDRVREQYTTVVTVTTELEFHEWLCKHHALHRSKAESQLHALQCENAMLRKHNHRMKQDHERFDQMIAKQMHKRNGVVSQQMQVNTSRYLQMHDVNVRLRSQSQSTLQELQHYKDRIRQFNAAHTVQHAQKNCSAYDAYRFHSSSHSNDRDSANNAMGSTQPTTTTTITMQELEQRYKDKERTMKQYLHKQLKDMIHNAMREHALTLITDRANNTREKKEQEMFEMCNQLLAMQFVIHELKHEMQTQMDHCDRLKQDNLTLCDMLRTREMTHDDDLGRHANRSNTGHQTVLITESGVSKVVADLKEYDLKRVCCDVCDAL